MLRSTVLSAVAVESVRPIKLRGFGHSIENTQNNLRTSTLAGLLIDNLESAIGARK